jgi:thioredoxin 2
VTAPCPFCGTANRVDPTRLDQGPRCGECHRPLLLDRPVRVTESQFDQILAGTTIPVLVDFYADWCGPCRILAPVVDQFAGQHAGSVLVLKLDTDQAPAISERFGIRGIPTLIAFRNGQESGRHVGLARAEQLAALTGTS